MTVMVPIQSTVSRSNRPPNPALDRPHRDSVRTGHGGLEEAVALRRAFVVQYGWCCQRCLQSFWWRDEDGLLLLVERHLTTCKGERHWDDD